MSDAVTTSAQGSSIFLTCQSCGAVSGTIPLDPPPSGVYWCGLCGEWAFDFDIVGLTQEDAWPDRVELTPAGPLGPEGKDNHSAVLVNVRPKWVKG